MKNQTFGIEIETTGLGCERTAKAIAAHFGTTARYVGRHLGDWHVPLPDGRKWVVERDWEDLSERVLARLELGERY